MKQKKLFTVLGIVFAFLAGGLVCLGHIQFMVTGKNKSTGATVNIGCWLLCSKADKSADTKCVAFRKWFFTDKDVQKNVKKFKMLNISAAVMFIVGALMAFGLGIVLCLQLVKAVKMKKEAKNIINLVMAGGAVLFILCGCILISVSFVPCLNNDSEFYTSLACRTVLENVYLHESSDDKFKVGPIFFMPWFALVFIILAMVFVVMAWE